MAEVRVERTEDGFRAVNGRGASVAVGDGDAEGVFTPVELLLAALGGCELVTVEPLTAKRGHRMARLAATVQADKIATSTLGTITVTYDVELPEGDAEAGDVLKAVAGRVHDKYCTVGSALREPMKVEQVV
ncbi:OsmC family protein [Actinomadura madurae]|uniref:OsmC family protein n=1 Tax=Actinomadura madurae TaxID=1993 RepID=UPI002025F0C1|nr:OsmC family protein [Actinomadura madurae]MCP9954779.1 OsmC family protein [Actinomadura madurae]MCP9984013.1 OsmC family protein [Actinomadura madurae]MCQ0004421.1 OsmC family protein [Actinomadura madurae]URN02418.1 OsmC family protein [Actinomadura madurae]